MRMSYIGFIAVSVTAIFVPEKLILFNYMMMK